MIFLSNVTSIINLINPKLLKHLPNVIAANSAWHRETIDHRVPSTHIELNNLFD